jgi:outer membrane protein OmpA-like peptidoglycan-associated protein
MISKRTLMLAVPLVVLAAACADQRMPPKALTALQRAEQAWRDDPDSPSTVDLALVADRKAQLAQATAATIRSQEEAQTARAQLDTMNSSALASARGQLNQTQQALGQTQMQLQESQVTSAAQAAQLADMEAKLKDARDTIAKIASVKDDSRGMVITLQGEVLFQTGKYQLKPAAMAKLDQIAEALKSKEQPITVYGYTDNVGGVDMNMTLSQNRAQSVRDYLVQKGIPQDLISAQGKGPADPVSDNTSVEGRAMNRRVELVVSPRK